MQFSTLLFGILPATIVLAAPASERRQAPPTWTLKGFSRECNATSCDYSFDVFEKTADTGICTVNVPGGPFTNFGPDIPCGPKNRFEVSGGWDEELFITVVVKDVTNTKWSFFGVTQDALVAGKVADQVSGVAPIGDFNFPA